MIPAWLAEDTPSFDYGGFVVGEGQEEAILWGKSEVSHPGKRMLYYKLAHAEFC